LDKDDPIEKQRSNAIIFKDLRRKSIMMIPTYLQKNLNNPINYKRSWGIHQHIIRKSNIHQHIKKYPPTHPPTHSGIQW